MAKIKIIAKLGKCMKNGMSKIKKVMEEFKEKTLHSGSKKGPIVKKKAQAVAIALNEARVAGAKIPKKKKWSYNFLQLYRYKHRTEKP